MNALSYTAEQPRQSGYYWHRSPNLHPSIVLISYEEKGGHRVRFHGKARHYNIADPFLDGSSWAGPLHFEWQGH